MRNLRIAHVPLLLLGAAVVACSPTGNSVTQEAPLHSGTKVTVTGSTSPSSVSAGQTVTVTLAVTSSQSTTLDVVMTVKSSSGQTGYTASWPGQAFQANVAQSFSEPIVVDATDPSGTYTVDVVVNRSGGQQLYHSASVTTFTVAAGAGDAGSGGTTGSCPSGALFCDDFTTASPPAPYIVQNGTWTRGSGTYTVTDSVAWQRAGAFLSTGNYGDFDVTLKASSRGDSGLGLFYAASSTTAGYAVIVHPASYQGVYLKKLNGTASDTNIASYALPSNLAGQAFTLRVTRVGSSVTVSFNGTQVISADDGSGGATGQLGMLLSDTGNVTGAGAVFTFFELASAGTGTGTDGGTGGGTPDAGTATGTIKNVFVVMVENMDWSQVKGNSSMPYVNNTLLPNYAHAENYITYNHPSLPNYVTLEAGSNLGLTNGSYEPTTNSVSTTDHLTTYLNRAGHSWKYYAESLPGNGTTCNLTDPGTPYSEDHNPFVYFDDVKSNTSYCIAHERPFSELASDLSAGTAPDYAFIVPNDYDQGEKLAPGSSCTVCQADTFLSQVIPKIQASPQYQNGGVILVLWDECASGSVPSGLIVVSPYAKKGYGNSVAYTHASTVRTVEEIFGLSPFLNDAATATDLADLLTVPL